MFLLSRLEIYLIIGAVVSAIALGMVKYHDHVVYQNAVLEQNQKQLELVLKSQEKFIADTKALNDLASQLTEQMTQQKQALDAQTKKIEDFLNSPEAVKGDRPSSDVLKKTIDGLRGKK